MPPRTDTGVSQIGALAFVNGTLYGFDNAGRNVLKIDTTSGLASALFPFPASLAGDKVYSAADIAANPGRFLVSPPAAR